MTPFEAIRQRHITKKGRTVTLKRGDTTQDILAFFVQWSPDDLQGTDLRQGDMRVELLADTGTVTAPPRNPDMLIAGNVAYTILFANPVYEANTLIGWTLAARGA